MVSVSVIIPNYNHAPFLRQRIVSVLEQTYPQFELILLDDASTDNSKAILNDYAGHPKVIHTVFNDKNSGSTFKQWLKGAELASGKYLWFAESDDYAEPHFLARMVTELEQHPSAGLAYCQSYSVDQTGFINGTIAWWNEALDREKWKTTHCASGRHDAALYASRHNIIFNASAVLIRKEAFFNSVPPSFNRYKLCGDWLIWVSVMRRYDLLFLAENLNYYRFHTQNVRTKTQLKRAAFYEMFLVRKYIWQHFTLTNTDKKNSAHSLLLEWKNWLKNGCGGNRIFRFLSSSVFMVRHSISLYLKMAGLVVGKNTGTAPKKSDPVKKTRPLAITQLIRNQFLES